MKRLFLISVMILMLSALSVFTANAEETTGNSSWVQVDSNWQYIVDNKPVKNEEITIDSKNYFFDTEGNLLTGIVNQGGKNYYYSTDGETPEAGLGAKEKGRCGKEESKAKDLQEI